MTTRALMLVKIFKVISKTVLVKSVLTVLDYDGIGFDIIVAELAM